MADGLPLACSSAKTASPAGTRCSSTPAIGSGPITSSALRPAPGRQAGFSDDGGQTWSSPEHLPAGLTGPIRAKPIVLPDSTIVSGTSVESYRSWAAWVERSTDRGETWTRLGPIVISAVQRPPPPPTATVDTRFPGGLIQPSIVQLRDRHLRLYARSTESTGRIAIADSYDSGTTWSQAHPIDVSNPNSGIDALALRDGPIVLIYNNTTRGAPHSTSPSAVTASTSPSLSRSKTSPVNTLAAPQSVQQWRSLHDLHLGLQDDPLRSSLAHPGALITRRGVSSFRHLSSSTFPLLLFSQFPGPLCPHFALLL